MNNLNLGSESSHFILLPYLHWRLWEPEIPQGRVPNLFLNEGSRGGIYSGHLLTRTRS